jgi:hypothetical protein
MRDVEVGLMDGGSYDGGIEGRDLKIEASRPKKDGGGMGRRLAE